MSWAAIKPIMDVRLNALKPDLVTVLPGVPSAPVPRDALPAAYNFYQGTDLGETANTPVPTPVYQGFTRVLVPWLDTPNVTEAMLALFVDVLPVLINHRATLDALGDLAQRVSIKEISADEGGDGFLTTPGGSHTYRTLTVRWEIEGNRYDVN